MAASALRAGVCRRTPRLRAARSSGYVNTPRPPRVLWTGPNPYQHTPPALSRCLPPHASPRRRRCLSSLRLSTAVRSGSDWRSSVLTRSHRVPAVPYVRRARTGLLCTRATVLGAYQPRAYRTTAYRGTTGQAVCSACGEQQRLRVAAAAARRVLHRGGRLELRRRVAERRPFQKGVHRP